MKIVMLSSSNGSEIKSFITHHIDSDSFSNMIT